MRQARRRSFVRFWRTRVGQRDFPHQGRNQLRLRAQLEMEIEQQDEADHYPSINNEIDAAANANQSGEPSRMRRQPDKVKSRGRNEHRQDGNKRSAPVFAPGIDKYGRE